ncbi:MAG: nucleotidyltransferase domain-containing protein [Spirochaetales bacterium]|nr:nucleotidyltransferase domain-containing protein [Spirochaetales bacterium]MCF7939484.1 nucleotidyltransferase domain-containing protein [Spirochaetales bacterium]
MSGFDPTPFIAYHREQNKREQELIEQLVEEAKREARRLAGRLVREAGVSGVILFGSLAEGTVYRREFDIDLAIEGGDEYRAVAIAEGCAFPVDVCDYDDLPETLRKRIDIYGIRLV